MGNYNQYKVLQKTRDAMILALREGFATDTVYTYTDSLETSRISVVDATPSEMANFPAIVISTMSGTEERYLGPDFLEEDDDQQDVSFVSIPVSIQVKTYAKDTVSRDELGDRFFEYMKIAINQLADNGVAIVKIRINSDSREFIDDRWWYNSNFSIDAYTEWKYTADDTYINIGHVKITVTEDI